MTRRSESLDRRPWVDYWEKDSDESEISYGRKSSCDSAAFRAILNFFGRSTRNSSYYTKAYGVVAGCFFFANFDALEFMLTLSDFFCARWPRTVSYEGCRLGCILELPNLPAKNSHSLASWFVKTINFSIQSNNLTRSPSSVHSGMTTRNFQFSFHLLQRYYVKDPTRMSWISCVFNRSSRQKHRSVPEMIDENSSVSLINVPFKK